MIEHKILIVEDNPDSRQLACWILEDAGFVVVAAETGEQALQLIQSQTFSLVVMDISLPKMDGKEATRAIPAIKHLKDLPILALTAHAIQEERDAIVASGVTDLLTKPVDEDALIYRVNELLNIDH